MAYKHLGLGVLILGLMAACSDDDDSPSNTAGSGNKAGQAGKSNTAAGDGSVATPGGSAGSDAGEGGEGGAMPKGGSPGIDGPPNVGGDPGLMLEPCPSDDAPAPAGFSGVCWTAQAWANGVDALELGAGRAPTIVAVTPDELTVAWSEIDSSLPTYFVADRATAGDAFGEAQELTLTGIVGLSPDGLRVTLANAGRLAEAVRVMTTLNDSAAQVALIHGASTATDITGFGLLGHLSNITRSSNVGALIDADSLPVLAGARELAARGVVPGGTKRNREAVEVAWAADVEEPDRWLLADAQTSGGLLFAVPEDQAKSARAALEAAGTPAAKIIGRLTAEPGIRVERSMRA